MKKTTNLIWVTFQKEGVHCYPAAATDPKLATGDWDDVSFLGVPHRHIFHFRVAIEVFTDDRDIEFIQFKRWLERLYSGEILALDHKSCEMISDELYLEITKKYPGRRITIEVSEDGENGAYAEYDVDQEDSKTSSVNTTVITDASGAERRVFYVDTNDIDQKTLTDYIDRFKNGAAPQTGSKDPHLDYTFDQTMKKIDQVTANPDLAAPAKKVSALASFKNSVKEAWKTLGGSE